MDPDADVLCSPNNSLPHASTSRAQNMCSQPYEHRQRLAQVPRLQKGSPFGVALVRPLSENTSRRSLARGAAVCGKERVAAPRKAMFQAREARCAGGRQVLSEARRAADDGKGSAAQIYASATPDQSERRAASKGLDQATVHARLNRRSKKTKRQRRDKQQNRHHQGNAAALASSAVTAVVAPGKGWTSWGQSKRAKRRRWK